MILFAGHYAVKYLLVGLVGALLSWILTPLVRCFALRIGMVDEPDARRINKVTIPRGGGIAVFAAYHLSLLLPILRDTGGALLPGGQIYLVFLLSSFFLLLLGFVDDLMDIRPWLKLIGQIGVATVLYMAGARVGLVLWFAMPAAVDYLLTLVWFIAIINSFNLIDGLDGLASGLAIIGAVGMAIVLFARQSVVSVIPLVALIGACLGFLRYNFHPASIFLGDSGSMFLGLVMATIPLLSGGKSAFVASVGVPLLVMGVPLFDAVLAIWRRSVRTAMPSIAAESGKIIRVMQPDKEHLHHRVLALVASQRRAAWILYGISGLMVAIALAASFFQDKAVGVLLLGFLTISLIMSRHFSNVELWDTGRALLHIAQAPIFNRLILPLYLAFDIFTLAVSWLIASRLTLMPFTRMHLLLPLPLFIVPIIMTFAFGSIYQRSWHHVRVQDYALLSTLFILGWTVGCVLMIFFGLRFGGWFRQALTFLVCAPWPLLGLRVVRELLSIAILRHDSQHIGAEKANVAVYGEPARLDSYISALILDGKWSERRIVGVLSDEISLSGRILYGYPVLGGTHELGSIKKRFELQGIVVFGDIAPEDLSALVEETDTNDLWLHCWGCDETAIQTQGRK